MVGLGIAGAIVEPAFLRSNCEAVCRHVEEGRLSIDVLLSRTGQGKMHQVKGDAVKQLVRHRVLLLRGPATVQRRE